MTKTEKAKLIADAKELKGRRRSRYVDVSEIETMAEMDRKRSLAGKTIRIYSEDGFVPNSYNYAAPIDYVERYYYAGKKYFAIGQTDAKRSNGNGALITVDSRAY